jgi:hypothetical protein
MEKYSIKRNLYLLKLEILIDLGINRRVVPDYTIS